MAAEDFQVKAAVLEQRIEGHEKICTERYGEIKESFTRVHGRLDGIFWGVIGLLMSMLAYAFVTWAPWVDKTP